MSANRPGPSGLFPNLARTRDDLSSAWVQMFRDLSTRVRESGLNPDAPAQQPTYNPGMERYGTETLFPDSGAAGMRPDPTPEEIAESRAAIGRFGRDVLFGPERGSAIPFVDEASDVERLVRDWGLSEQEFRASAEAFGEGRIGSGLGWGLLGTMAAVPIGGWAGRAIGKLGKAAKSVEPQITVRASDVKRVEGIGEHWFDIPDVTRPGEMTRLPGGSGRDPGGQMTLGGRPMRRSEVPDELFHVTTDMQGIMSDGMIRVSRGMNQGAGGYSGTGAVSTTASREIAESIAADLRVFAGLKDFKTHDEVIDFFTDMMRSQNFDADIIENVVAAARRQIGEATQPAHTGKYLFDQVQWQRRMFGGPPPTIILGDPLSDYWRAVRPNNIDIIPIRKNMIPDEALVSNYDLGQRSLDEIQVYSDIPVSGRAGGEGADVGRAANATEAWGRVLSPQTKTVAGTELRSIGVGDSAFIPAVSADGKPRLQVVTRSESAMPADPSTVVPFSPDARLRPLVKTGEEIAPTHVYRVMSRQEFELARERGYIQSAGDRNLVSGEGTVFSLRPTGEFYAPASGDGVVVRVRYDDADGWFVGPEGPSYVKTESQIPFDRVDAFEEFGSRGANAAQGVRSPLVQEGATTVPGPWAERALRAGDAAEVPTEWARQFQEYDRRANPIAGSDLDAIKASILQEGFRDPLIIEVGLNGRISLIEGNHRLAAALELGLENVPVRVITSREGPAGSRFSREGISQPSIVRVQEGVGDGWYLKPSDAIVGVPDPVSSTPNLDKIGRGGGVR
jgi:hypothetical protein